MKVFRIRKRSGAWRTIFAPSDEEKEKLRRCLPALNEKQERVDVSDVAHGFRAGRSPVTNAMQHVGYNYTLSFDLSDFFDSVTPDKMEWLWAVGFYWECYLDSRGNPGWQADRASLARADHAARQGLPTSPLIANIAAAGMDSDICALNQEKPPLLRRLISLSPFRYTRYADDLTLSFNEEEWADKLRREVPVIVTRHGFKINEAKTHLQCSKAGRRVITGIAVDDKLHATRAVKRRLRAMLHQGHMQQAQGLAEWASLKVPKAYAPRAAEPVKKAAPAKMSRPAITNPSPPPIIVARRRFQLDE